MNLVGFVSTAVLSLSLIAAAPVFAQEHEQQEEQKPRAEEKKRQPEKSAKPEQKPQTERQDPRREEKTVQPHEQQQQKQDQNHQAQQRDQQQQEQNHQAQQHAQQQERENGNNQSKQAQQLRPNQHPQRTQEQQRVQQASWKQHESRNWDSDHRNWQQRGGYHGYRIPDDRYRGYFGPDHGFRIYGLPFMVVGGFPRFQYEGYWISLVDPWPQYWGNDWYDNDDVYITYVDNGYYLYNRRYPNVGIAISMSM